MGIFDTPAGRGPNSPLTEEERKERKRRADLSAARKSVGTGLKGIGETAEGLFDKKADAIREAAKKRTAARMRGAEKGIAADVGRSARMARGGGRGAMLADVGAGLESQAKADAASAEEKVVDTKLEKQQFMAEKYVSPAEAASNVEAMIKSLTPSYSGTLGDNEIGMAEELEKFAARADISPAEEEYALEQARKFRLYEESMFPDGARGLGSV